MSSGHRCSGPSPIRYGMPETIQDSPDSVMAAIERTKPKRPGEWQYEKQARRDREDAEGTLND